MRNFKLIVFLTLIQAKRFFASMKRSAFLLAALVLLYLVPALILEGVYGESYALFSGSGYWSPDGEGGWIEVGSPDEPEPEVRSESIPIALLYLPLVLPVAVLALFLFTPLSKLLRDDPDTSGEDDVFASHSEDK